MQIENLSTEVNARLLYAQGAAIIADRDEFVGNVTAKIIMLAAYTGSSTVTVQTTPEDPASPGSPLTASWAAAQEQPPGESAPANIAVAIADTNEEFVAKGYATIDLPITCSDRFLRVAVTGATTTNLAVVLIGKRRNAPGK